MECLQRVNVRFSRLWSFLRVLGGLLDILLCKSACRYWQFTEAHQSAPKLSSYGVDVIGMPLSAATTLTIVVNGAGLPFRLIPPLFADRYGQLNVRINLKVIKIESLPVHFTFIQTLNRFADVYFSV